MTDVDHRDDRRGVSTPNRPNVLFVLTDQERYDCTAPDGPPVETPTFDRLSREGVRFTDAITPISICTSARASLLTGRWPHAHGMLNNSHEADAIRSNLPSDAATFSEELASRGYELTYTGKWHVGRERTPEAVGFSYLGGSDTHHDDIDDAFREYRDDRGTPLDETDAIDPIYTHDDPEEGTLVAAESPLDVEDSRAHFLADRAIESIERHVAGRNEGGDTDADRRFFHRADFYGPHHPYVVPEPYASMYDPSAIEPWGSYAETFDGKPAVHEHFLDYRGVADFDWDTWAAVVSLYWGFVTLIDEQVGRVLDALDERGIAEDTLVVHSSDHGDFAGGHRQFNKGPIAYDDTYRIPLQLRWPGVIESGTTVSEPVHLHDLAPTFLDVADVPVPEAMQADSLRPLFPTAEADDPTGATEWPEAAFAQYHGDEFGLYSQRMVRTVDHKFVYNGPDRNELYDLENDPHELQNLIDHPAYADVRNDLETRLVQWMTKTDDPLARWVPKTLG